MPRIPYDASTEAEVRQYYATRARQLLHDGFVWRGDLAYVPGYEGKAFVTTFDLPASASSWVSYFVLPAYRGQGLLRPLVARGLPIVTLQDCHIEGALAHVGATFRVAGHITETVEYKLIESFYGDRRAQRSQVFLMNHIDEGLAVMAAVGASDSAMRAFCLHPLLQNDSDLTENHARVAQAMAQVEQGAYVLSLAMEYRSVANEYLAHCAMRSGGIRLSPLKDVNDMLIGDKVQNRKDFELHHAETHANRVRLAQYFHEWCDALGVSARYTLLKTPLPSAP